MTPFSNLPLNYSCSIKGVDPIFELIIFTGFRKGEALGLMWKDIDLDRGEIRIVRSLARTKEKRLFLKEVKTQKSKKVYTLCTLLYLKKSL
ncbi:tyrosine-type recombinase/integrase [Cytobacillus firmus]|uniref:tyrosine-type recombinase/integrase n=1 Tax=Cytobacillus firmus TaxID=1399 RepID=UPI0039B6F0F7